MGKHIQEKNGLLSSRPELVANGTFDTDVSGWSASNGTITWVSGLGRVTAVGNLYAYTNKPISTIVGQTYKFSATIAQGTASQYIIRLGTSIANSSGKVIDTGPSSSFGNIEYLFTAADTTTYIQLWNGNNIDGTYTDFDNISVKEVSTIDNLQVQDRLLVGTDGLPNATADHKLQVNGIPMHGLIWKDLIAEFIPARGGAINEPAWSDIGNGIVMSTWSENKELPVAYHVNHDYALGTDAYPHIHFMCADAQSAGAQVTWRFSYVVARGHSQGDSLTAATTDIDMTYTFTGSEVPGEHIVLECNDAQAFDLLEPDTVVLAQVTLLSENVAGAIYGIQADLHYQANVEGTISKSPDFTVA